MAMHRFRQRVCIRRALSMSLPTGTRWVARTEPGVIMSAMRRKIVTIVGARPQFIKAFALSRVLKDDRDFEEVLVHTGQHYDDNMSAVFFKELDIPPPRHHFAVETGAQGAVTGQMLKNIE